MPPIAKSRTDLSSPFGGQGAYDYIIAGAGCAGLSLAVRLAQSPVFANSTILLVDKDAKQNNDRTWCFWEKGAGLFEPIVYKSWQQLSFFSPSFSKDLDIAPYSYKLIRGIDFYQYCFSIIDKHPNIHFLQGEIDEAISEENKTGITVNGQWIEARCVFSSLYQKPPAQPKDLWLLQHFKGWVIETEEHTFNPQKATLMDFRTGQEQGATFFYVMPFTERKALIEYTLFSPALLPEAQYEAALKAYIEKQLGIQQYVVKEKEFGVIPMTNASFPRRQHNIRYIGTAGGQTKGSSGYTFQFIQKETAAIVSSLERHGHPFSKPVSGSRFAFYDEVLLSVLFHKRLSGSEVFTRFFKKNRPEQILKFLDNETKLPEEIAIISTLPTLPFAKAALWKYLG